jgi:hypothetical protein
MVKCRARHFEARNAFDIKARSKHFNLTQFSWKFLGATTPLVKLSVSNSRLPLYYSASRLHREKREIAVFIFLSSSSVIRFIKPILDYFKHEWPFEILSHYSNIYLPVCNIMLNLMIALRIY